MQKPSGDAARGLVPADRALPPAETEKPADETEHLTGQFRKTGKPRSRTKTIAKITARGKSSEWSAFGKTCCATTNRVRRLTENSSLRLFSGAGEGIRTPDPLITNQMLYRLSYASKFGTIAPSRKPIPLIPSECPGQF